MHIISKRIRPCIAIGVGLVDLHRGLVGASRAIEVRIGGGGCSFNNPPLPASPPLSRGVCLFLFFFGWVGVSPRLSLYIDIHTFITKAYVYQIQSFLTGNVTVNAFFFLFHFNLI